MNLLANAGRCIAPRGAFLQVNAVQRRWRTHPKGGRHGPQFNHMPTEVKLEWPPKDRSQLFLLPDSKRLMCVTHGWYYPDGLTGKANKKMSAILCIASKHIHNIRDSLTAAEVRQLWALEPQIRSPGPLPRGSGIG
ncbi:unnamed protein product [Durusdinium trenchii]|uniref:Uncharacterized protein n=1 Tax=Durusdinium trenchii TaxID=1381693 RepID=A0ABP0PHH4_9DINO